MADIELVIKIPKGLKNDFELEQWTALSCMEMKNALEKATPLPEGHGDLIDACQEMRLMRSYDYDTYEDYLRAFDMLDNAPAVIKADKGETE